MLVCIYRQRRPRREVSCAVALELSVEFLPRPSVCKEASLRVNLRALWSHARFRATNHDWHLKKRLWNIYGPLSGKFYKENVWKSSEYVFICFVRRSISRFFRGQLQCDDRDNKDSEGDNSREQCFLHHLSSLAICPARLNHGQLSQFISQFCSFAGIWH